MLLWLHEAGVMRTGPTWHGGSNDHGNDDREVLPSAPLGDISTGTHGTAWHSTVQSRESSLELLEVGARKHTSHQKGENSFGDLNGI